MADTGENGGDSWGIKNPWLRRLDKLAMFVVGTAFIGVAAGSLLAMLLGAVLSGLGVELDYRNSNAFLIGCMAVPAAIFVLWVLRIEVAGLLGRKGP